ncbi:MAG: Ig-like domain-containing protein [Candidatus Zixiibacteriota bacterium]
MSHLYRSLFFLGISAFIIIFINCAKLEYPSGGPEDKEPPKIYGTIPGAEAINVPRNDRISIQFSEKIERSSIEDAIFITPRIKGDFKYKWKKNLLTVILPDSFVDSTTYIVNIGSSIADLRRNKMADSYTLAFSTGKIINRGMIYGTVFQANKPLANATVALYDSSMYKNNASFDSLYPPYMTQSGSDGTFKLEYLPDGEYFLLAFQDKNKNQWFNYPKEPFGVPDRPVNVVLNNDQAGINLFMMQKDSGDVAILSAGYGGENLVKVRLSHNIAVDLIRHNLDKIFIENYESVRSNPISLKERADIEKQSTFNFYFDSLKSGQYKVLIEDSFLNSDTNELYLESATFDISLKSDSTPPNIISFSHKDKTIYPYDSLMNIVFSKPMNRQPIDNQAIKIMKSDSSEMEFSAEWFDPFQINLSIDGLGMSETYQLTVNTGEFSDIFGNKMKDSLISFDFSTYNEDSLGSVSGKVNIDSSLGKMSDIYISFYDANGKEQLTKKLINSNFAYQLMPGKYMLKGFMDSNKNGRHDEGGIFPFDYAERMSFHPDTIRVRARFESAGIEFKF